MQPDEMQSGTTRRQALKKAAASFMILPAGLARGYAANEKLNVGVIGLTGMGALDSVAQAGVPRLSARQQEVKLRLTGV